MQAVVMAGGEGTRLRPLTCNRPKPMVPIVNRPVMEHIINLLKKQGITEIFVTLCYLPQVIQDYFGDGSDFGVKIKYFIEETPLGTAGSVKQIEKDLTDTFVIISGDALTDVNLLEALAFHKEKDALATLVLTHVEEPLEYGVVVTDDLGRIKHFLEKPNWSEVFSDTVNTGIYILEPECLKFFAEGKNFDFSKDLFPLLLGSGYPLYGFLTSGYWCDVGNIEQYHQANHDVLEGKVKLQIPGKCLYPGIWVEDGTVIDSQAILIPPIFLGANCQLREGVKLERYTVLGNNCLIDKGAKLKRSILFSNDYIGKNSNIAGAVIGENCYLQSNVKILEGAVIGDHCKLEGRSQVKSDIKVWPGKEVQWGISVVKNMIWGDGARSLFTCQGVKGLVNIELTAECMARLGCAYGAFLPKQSSVIVTSDGSRSASMLQKAFLSGLVASGVNVYDLERLPLPMAKYSVKLEEIKGGAYIALCPSDLERVEIRFFDSQGIDLDKGKLKKLETLFYRGDFRKISPEELGEIQPLNGLKSDYIRKLIKNLAEEKIKNQKLKLVVEYNHSNTCLVLPTILNRLGCAVISLNAYVDEENSLEDKQTNVELLKQLSTVVLATQSDLGILMDKAGEKIFLIDNQGRIVNMDQVLLLLSFYRLQKLGEGRIALPVTAPWFLESMLEEYQGKVIRTKASSSSLLEKSQEENVLLAGNEQGAFVFPEFQTAFDGMRAVGEILELITKGGKDFSQLVNDLPKLICLRDSVFCSWGSKGKVMRTLIQEVEREKMDLLDGIRIFAEQSSILVLPDGEQPLFHLFAEGSSQEKVKSLLEKYAQKIRHAQRLSKELRKVR